MAAVLAIAGSMRLATNWRDGSLFTSTTDAVRRNKARTRPKDGIRREIRLPRWLEGMGTSPLARTLGGRINLRRWIVVLVVLQILGSLPVILSVFVGGMGGGMVIGLLGIPVFFAGLAAELILIYTACRIFSDARHTGEMEILLTSPVTDRELVITLWHLLRNGLIWVFAIMVLQAMIQVAGQDDSLMFGATQTTPLWVPILSAVLNLVAEALHLVGVVWAAMWFGLKSTKTSGAMIKTFVLVIVVTGLIKWILYVVIQIPLMTGFFSRGTPPGWFMSLYVIVPSVIGGILSFLWYLWARKQLFTKFRQVVTETETRSLWIDRLENRLVPPPLPSQSPPPTKSA